MADTFIGYEFLRRRLRLSAFEIARPAAIKPVTRVEPLGTVLAVPKVVAPSSDAPLEHLLFALKHEGIELQTIAQVVRHIQPHELHAALQASPNGQYIRRACFMWEELRGETLQDVPAITAPYVDLLDPRKQVVGASRRSPKWRVDANQLGSLKYSPQVRRTPQIEAYLQQDILAQAGEFTRGLDKTILDRAISWAYLGETEGSYAIEGEVPTEDKTLAFARLLRQAHEQREISEEMLVDLHNIVVTNPLLKAVQFRNQQNWLRGAGRGAGGITYVPPPPGPVPELMDEFMSFANTAPGQIDHVIAGSLSAFGFVFIHPFMDGNGRLSRFLFHQAVCQSEHLQQGLILPVSVAMKRNELEYLDALRSFSAPARERWSVTWADGEDFSLTFKGDDSIYRFWDATQVVEFGFRMAQQALDVDLRHEAQYLAHFDAVVSAVNSRFDIKGSDLALLVRASLENKGVVSKNRRKQFALTVQPKAFDLIEVHAKRVLGLS